MKEYLIQAKTSRWGTVMHTNASNDIEFLKAYDGLIKMFKADYPEYNNDEFRGVRRETTYTDTVLT